MGFLSVLGMAHKLVEQRVSRGDAVVDATCGNGVDTQFLAGLVGPRGTVYAFDVQREALDRTRARLAGGEPSSARRSREAPARPASGTRGGSPRAAGVLSGVDGAHGRVKRAAKERRPTHRRLRR